ncbi:MAG: hypothetical protein JNM57_00210 [Cyclobacteriaceae bacterium]|nr:hypothetical protein [Cyclobacteriaceae bacterium]
MKKILYLFAALLLPVLVFVFLKFFGKNEFNVDPLFVHDLPINQSGCSVPQLPYHIPDSVLNQFSVGEEGLMLFLFAPQDGEIKRNLNRVSSDFPSLTSSLILKDVSDDQTQFLKKCIFFLSEPFNLVLVDSSGTIRGQYKAHDREDTDRLVTELTIILKQY